MQVARRRWSAVLIAGSAVAPKDVCIRRWLLQSACHGLRQRNGDGARVRAGAATNTNGH